MCDNPHPVNLNEHFNRPKIVIGWVLSLMGTLDLLPFPGFKCFLALSCESFFVHSVQHANVRDVGDASHLASLAILDHAGR